MSQFQRPMTIRPNNPMATIAIATNLAIRFGRIALLLFIEEFVDLAQALPQVDDGVVLAGDQSVAVHAAGGGQLLEPAALQLVADEAWQARLLAVGRVGYAPVLLFPHPVAMSERLGHHYC